MAVEPSPDRQVRPTPAQRRLLERLGQGAVLRMPPWSRHVRLIPAGAGETPSVPTATFRVLLRHGWIERESGPDSQVPSFRLSAAGQAALDRAGGEG